MLECPTRSIVVFKAFGATNVSATCPLASAISSYKSTPTNALLSSCLLLLGQQVPQRKIIHNILHILNPVLEPVTTPAQAVVLQVENLEASKQILDELVDQKGTLVVTKCNGIACKTRLYSEQASLEVNVKVAYQLFYKRDEGLQVFLKGEVELVSLFEVNRDCAMSVSYCASCLQLPTL